MKFEFGQLAVEFNKEDQAKVLGIAPDMNQKGHIQSVAESSLPIDLRTDNITDTDKVLMWSASPDQSEGSLPGTGEKDL